MSIIFDFIARLFGHRAAQPSPAASKPEAEELPWLIAARQLQTLLNHWNSNQPNPNNREAENDK